LLALSIIVRTTKQLGAAIQRRRKEQELTQSALGTRMNARQATVSKLEKGEPATQLQVVMNALTALGLELVVRPRTTSSVKELEDLF
jgi:HTH-type transcriptional regulator/antitoxin HipB